RSYFLSPVALIFLGVFLVATLFIFFTASKFFVRNLADVRPLFSWLPLLLIFLVAAVTMRQWSEEQKMGTLEVLLTLPLKTRDLVLGKFVAGLGLIGVALALTLPLPITVSLLGDLDWGPVIGGYVAALLVASTYLAIGLCVSARTDNQIVALLVTAIVGSLLYFIGSESIVGLFGHQTGEILRSIGTGSRFESIERGVLDLRDLAYYGSLTAFFLALNVHFLELKRLESQPKDGESRRRPMTLAVALAALNVVALNLWLAPVTKVRADLTADGEYSVSQVTEDILTELAEPLTITGYFSQKTHPLLSPLIPRIRDFLTEYEVRGGGNVRLNFVDPNADPQVEEEINDQYGIKSVPFRISGRNEESVVNSYFHVLIRYGDEYEVLSFDDLIEIHADDNEVVVRLRNMEYDVTRSIKKVTQGFQSIEAVMARAGQTAKLTAYVSGDLPKEFEEVPARLKKVAEALAEKTGGRLTFEQIDPAGDANVAREIQQKYGFRPMAVDLFGEKNFYLYVLLTMGEKAEPVFLQGELSDSDLRTDIEAAIQRMTPGFLKTIGLLTKQDSPPAQQNPYGPPPAPVRDFRGLEGLLSSEFQVRLVDGEDGAIPGDIDVLLVGKPGELTDKQKFAVDQYLMRGG
ncbi:MAG: Gldg family protein, partial [Myxococcales bacterium]|nr:Gldg family protein [Myxococcales bacterium]